MYPQQQQQQHNSPEVCRVALPRDVRTPRALLAQMKAEAAAVASAAGVVSAVLRIEQTRPPGAKNPSYSQ